MGTMANLLETKIAGMRLKNPTILASGILGMSPEITKRIVDSGAGAITIKSLGGYARTGHSNPCVVGWECGLVNAVGLTGQGLQNFEWNEYEKIGKPIIISVFGDSIEQYVDNVKFVAQKNPAAIELNLSCPNKENGMVWSMKCEPAEQVVKAAKKVSGKVPLFAKLTPQAPNIAEVARACEKAGADGITAINTLGPGMIIDINSGRPVLSYKKGGVSGPAIRPIAVRCVYDIYEAVKIPIIGTGGITNGRDAIEMVMAGATALGIGSAAYYQGFDVFRNICDEMRGWMKEHHYKSINELKGLAHK
jgi:dihydroorotate dehydrogenase (NAD+) catalytic subunit